MNVDYSSPTVPPEYRCSVCGAIHVKLWREYQAPKPRLLCASCALADQDRAIDGIDDAGEHTTISGVKTNSIGWFVPAVPFENKEGFWGKTAIPERGSVWWKALPTRPNNPQ